MQVTVLDDGLPVTEPKVITLTLDHIQRNPSESDDIFLDIAELIIPVTQGILYQTGTACADCIAIVWVWTILVPFAHQQCVKDE